MAESWQTTRRTLLSLGAATVLFATATACSGSSDSGAASTSSSDELMVLPPSTTALPTSESSSSDSFGATSNTSPPTLPEACVAFSSLPLSEQMAQVRDAQAPAETACTTIVANAAQAVDAVEASAGLFAELNVDETDPLSAQYDCQVVWRFDATNNFTAPIRFFGSYGWLAPDSTWSSMRPMLGPNVPPSATATHSVDFDETNSETGCDWSGAVFMSAEPLRPFDYPSIAPDDDPQASDDPAVWFPALQEQLNIGRAEGSVDYLIDHAVDPHSFDLQISTATAISAASLTYCSRLDVDWPADLQGEWAALLVSGDSGRDGEAAGLFLGLFARNSDRRWRAVAIDVPVPWAYDPADPCTAPPLD